MILRQESKYRDSSSRTSSASRDSDSGVKPTRSANSTETRRRSATGASTVAVAPVAAPLADASPRGAPQSPQNLFPGGFSPPHVEQLIARALPQSLQNRLPAGFSAPQFAHVTICKSLEESFPPNERTPEGDRRG